MSESSILDKENTNNKKYSKKKAQILQNKDFETESENLYLLDLPPLSKNFLKSAARRRWAIRYRLSNKLEQRKIKQSNCASNSDSNSEKSELEF